MHLPKVSHNSPSSQHSSPHNPSHNSPEFLGVPHTVPHSFLTLFLTQFHTHTSHAIPAQFLTLPHTVPHISPHHSTQFLTVPKNFLSSFTIPTQLPHSIAHTSHSSTVSHNSHCSTHNSQQFLTVSHLGPQSSSHRSILERVPSGFVLGNTLRCHPSPSKPRSLRGWGGIYPTASSPLSWGDTDVSAYRSEGQEVVSHYYLNFDFS